MRDIIKITVDADHYLRCPVDTIARDGEGNVTELEITFPEKLASYWVYLDFKMSNGEKFKSPRLDVEGNKATYTVPPYVLVEGKLKMQVLFQNEHGKIWKSYKKPFNVRPSINAVEDIPDKEDFIAEAQKLLDEIEKGGENTAVLFTKQTLTDEQKAQARENIGAGTGEKITVDAELSDTSTNPVQNKVVADEISAIKKDLYDKSNGLDITFGYAVDALANAETAQQTAIKAGSIASSARGALDFDVYPRLTAVEEDVADLKKNGGSFGGAVLNTTTHNNGDVVTVSNVLDVVLHGKTSTRPSKNLCSLRNAEVVTDNFTAWKEFDIEEIPAGEYAISADIVSTASTDGFRVAFLDAEGNEVKATNMSKLYTTDERFAAVYVKIPAPFCKLRLSTAVNWVDSTNQTATYTDIQIEARQVNTPFEPYGDIVNGVPANVSFGDVVFSADVELYDGDTISFANGLLKRSDGTKVSIECTGDVASLNGTYELSADGVVDIIVDVVARNSTDIDNLKQTTALCAVEVDSVKETVDSVKENFVEGKKIGYSFGNADPNSVTMPYAFSIFGGYSIPIMKNSIMGTVCGIKLCLIFNASEMPVVLELYDQNKNLIKKLAEETVVAYPKTPPRDGVFAVFHTFDCEFDKSIINTDAAYIRVYIPNTTASSVERIRIGYFEDTSREEIDVNVTPVCYTAVGNDTWKADVTVDGAGGYVNRPDNTFIQIIEKSLEANPNAIKPAFDYSAYGLPVLEFNGNISMMSKDVAVKLSYKYDDREGSCTLKWQGSSSLTYPKKNYTVKFDHAFEAKEGWGEQKKYCLKANYIDFTHCRNVVSAKLWGQIVASRSVADATLASCPNYGAVDGFPVVVVINGEFQGVFTFNIPKDAWMMNMGSGANECIICADKHTESNRFKEEATLDGDFEVEYITDEDDTAWALTSVNNLINACINTDGTDLDTTIAAMLDWDSAIDYWIFVALLCGGDMITKNYLLFTHDGTKWKFGAYDIDSTYGLSWDGTSFGAANRGCTFDACAGNHRVPELIKRYKKDALKARYKELRGSVMSEDNVSCMFRNFAGIIPKHLLDEDNRKWPLIPNTNANSVQQIIDWYRLRCLYIDKEVEMM